MKTTAVKSLTRKIAMSGLFLALALIVSLIENLIPPVIPALPYAKIGLGNVILLACFLCVGIWEGYAVLLLRCLLNAVFAANMASLIWSIPAALTAYTLMIALYKTKAFSITGVSAAGGMTHNFIQICVASAVVGQSVFAYLPYMLLAGGLAGFATGVICYFSVKALEKLKLTDTDRAALRSSQDEEDTPCSAFDDASNALTSDTQSDNAESGEKANVDEITGDEDTACSQTDETPGE